MTDFYPSPDRFCWPIIINSANKKLRVTEDPGGANEANIDITLTETSALAATEHYYAVGAADPTTSPGTQTVEVDDSGSAILKVNPLYDEIADKLETESSSTGNGLLYQFTSVTPSGSDHANTGIELQQVTDSTNIQYDFSISNTLSPRLFGFAEGTSTAKGGSSNSIAGDFTRWGMWFSHVAAHDKRPVGRDEAFTSSPRPYDAKRWRFTDRSRVRMHEYIGVAGVHVFPDDRASRSTEADRGGLPTNDRNNALWDLWRHANFGDRKVLVGHHAGTDGLSKELSSSAEQLNIAKIHGEWQSSFDPQGQTDRQHAGEKYDLSVKFAIADDGAYDTSNVSIYKH